MKDTEASTIMPLFPLSVFSVLSGANFSLEIGEEIFVRDVRVLDDPLYNTDTASQHTSCLLLKPPGLLRINSESPVNSNGGVSKRLEKCLGNSLRWVYKRNNRIFWNINSSTVA